MQILEKYYTQMRSSRLWSFRYNLFRVWWVKWLYWSNCASSTIKFSYCLTGPTVGHNLRECYHDIILLRHFGRGVYVMISFLRKAFCDSLKTLFLLTMMIAIPWRHDCYFMRKAFCNSLKTWFLRKAFISHISSLPTSMLNENPW